MKRYTVIYERGPRNGSAYVPDVSVADILDAARSLRTSIDASVPPYGVAARDLGVGRVIPMDRISHEHYIRFHLADRPGVLAKISSILAKEGISIATVSQHERAQRGVIPVVMRTHLARESSLRRALARITRLEAVRANPVVIRVEERLGEATDR